MKRQKMNSTFFTRRTIRKYEGRDVGNILLDRILTAGTRASTTGNMQVYSIIVTRDADMKARLSPAHFEPADGDRGSGGAHILRRFQQVQ